MSIKLILFLIAWELVTSVLLVIVIVMGRLWVVLTINSPFKHRFPENILVWFPMIISNVYLIVLILILLKSALWPLRALYRIKRGDTSVIQEIQAKNDKYNIWW